MRIAYTSNPHPQTPEEDSILQRIRGRRPSTGLSKLDLVLLHSPQVADALNTLAETFQRNTSIPGDLRETAILRVAAICHCWYEWDLHTAAAREAGIPEEGIQGILKGDASCEWLTEKQRAVIEYADAVSSGGCHVTDAHVEKLRNLFDDKQIVEMTACIAGFNSVARFVSALDVGEKNGPWN